MATLMRIAVVAGMLAGCGDIAGFSGTVPPLATFTVEVTGELDAVRVDGATGERLRVALVWGDQWLPEPLCFLPADSPEAATVLAAGCRDPLGFVPQRVTTSIAIEPNTPTELALATLPTADVMVGDVTARIAYASLVVFDDRDDNETLGLERARTGGFGQNPDEMAPPRLDRDIIYASSFVSMTEPDTRIALREGSYNAAAAFYPRVNCGVPPAGFSILSAGGFPAAEAIAATLRGELPAQDPATCREALPADETIALSFRDPDELSEIGCLGRRADSSVRYREPPRDPLNLDMRVAACAALPSFGEDPPPERQYIVSTRADDACRGVIHYVLRGCDEDPSCEVPEWDVTNNPPDWWPCGP